MNKNLTIQEALTALLAEKKYLLNDSKTLMSKLQDHVAPVHSMQLARFRRALVEFNIGEMLILADEADENTRDQAEANAIAHLTKHHMPPEKAASVVQTLAEALGWHRTQDISQELDRITDDFNKMMSEADKIDTLNFMLLRSKFISSYHVRTFKCVNYEERVNRPDEPPIFKPCPVSEATLWRIPLSNSSFALLPAKLEYDKAVHVQGGLNDLFHSNFSNDTHQNIRLIRPAVVNSDFKITLQGEFEYGTKFIPVTEPIKTPETVNGDGNKPDPNKITEQQNNSLVENYQRIKDYQRTKIQVRSKTRGDKIAESISYYNAGFEALHKKKYDEALADFNKVIELNPNYADAYFYRAFIFESAKQYHDKAIADYSKAVELNPNNELYRKSLRDLLR